MTGETVTNPFGLAPMSESQSARYYAAAHAVQAGTKALNHLEPTNPVDCRIGLNVTMAEFSTVTQLFVSKGLITLDELYETLIKANEAEKARMEERLTKYYGSKFTLV